MRISRISQYKKTRAVYYEEVWINFLQMIVNVRLTTLYNQENVTDIPWNENCYLKPLTYKYTY